MALVLVALCAALVGGLWYVRSGAAATPDDLVRHIPVRADAIIAIDIARLRDAGILERIAGSPSSEEADYRNFADATGFEYRTDLDYAVLGIAKSDIFCVAKGRYDWPALMNYAQLQGGLCALGTCRLPSAGRERRISYFPLRRNVLALGVGGDEWLVAQLQEDKDRDWKAPSSPLWIRLEESMLSGSRPIPEGLQPVAMLLQGAKSALLTVQPRDFALAAQLEVRCKSTADANRIHDGLKSMTSELERMTAADSTKPGPSIPGLLSRGEFRVDGSNVTGAWTVDASFLNLLAAGR
jgi:hypothetical protein